MLCPAFKNLCHSPVPLLYSLFQSQQLSLLTCHMCMAGGVIVGSQIRLQLRQTAGAQGPWNYDPRLPYTNKWCSLCLKVPIS